MDKKRDIFHEIHGFDTWCVPCAFSALLGVSTDIVRTFAIGVDGKLRGLWQGIRVTVTKQMLIELGIDFDEVNYSKSGAQAGAGPHPYHKHYGTDMRPTFNQWAGGRKRTRRGLFIVAAGHHMLIYCDGMVVDNGFGASRTPVFYTKIKRKRARMNYTLELDRNTWDPKKVQFPRWAVTAATELAAARIFEGPRAKIEEAMILKVKQQEEREALEREAAAAPSATLVPRPKPVPGKPKSKCSRCEKPSKTKGLCGGCYSKAKRSGEFGHPKCEAPGCEKFAESKKGGLCHSCGHRKQRAKGKWGGKGEAVGLSVAPPVIEFEEFNGISTVGARIIVDGERVGTIGTGHREGAFDPYLPRLLDRAKRPHVGACQAEVPHVRRGQEGCREDR